MHSVHYFLLNLQNIFYRLATLNMKKLKAFPLYYGDQKRMIINDYGTLLDQYCRLHNFIFLGPGQVESRMRQTNTQKSKK